MPFIVMEQRRLNDPVLSVPALSGFNPSPKSTMLFAVMPESTHPVSNPVYVLLVFVIDCADPICV